MKITVQPTLVANRYELQAALGVGGMGTVYRAYDRLTRTTVALKQISITEGLSEQEQLVRRLAIAREFRTVASMHHPGIVSVLDYGFHEGLPFFTMDLLVNARPVDVVGRDLPLGRQVGLLVKLLQALAYLHRRGVIHQDLKPANVLVTPDNIIKVLDFGLAKDTMHAPTAHNQERTGGTLYYMAPELFSGGDASVASDLYAVGVIACEIMLGRYPFIVKNSAHLLMAVMTYTPNLTGIEPEIALVIGKLLSKNPAERYQNAHEVARHLCAAAKIDLPPQSVEERESFLQAAAFIGRDEELNVLSQALDNVLNGKGSAWLVAGESGVGKSRLLEELRTRALVKGALVVRGQAVVEDGPLYLAWRSAQRHLCLFTPLDDHEARVLKPLVPDIAELIGRPVADAPLIPNPQAVTERLLKVIETVVKRAAKQPVVIILEDLHWAGDSLEVLARLQRIVGQLPLMVVGSYRDDETPHLPQKLTGMSVLKLNRFTPDHVALLCQSMLGQANLRPEVLALVQRDTEGNVFFIVEVMRALAEESGALEKVGSQLLPDHVVAGGVRRVVRRRLEHLPQAARPLLELAAVAGRELNLKLLALCAPDSDLNVWLNTCQAFAVLEVNEQSWRFSHDQLREAILEDLAPPTRAKLHQQVAEALEYLYPESPEYDAILAFHWNVAGDHAKVVHYASRAGFAALNSGADHQSKAMFAQALNALHKLPQDDHTRRQQVDITVAYARVSSHILTENITQVIEAASQAAAALGDEERLVRAMSSHSAHLYMRGYIAEALEMFDECIVRGERLGGVSDALVLPYNLLGRTVMTAGDFPLAERLLAQGIPLAEAGGDLELMSGSLAFYACVLRLQGRHEESLPYEEQALQLAEAMGHQIRLTINRALAASTSMMCGNFALAVPRLKEIREISDQMQLLTPMITSRGNLGVIHVEKGEYPRARTLLDEAINTAMETKSVMYLPIYLAARAEVDWAFGDMGAARERLLHAAQWGEDTKQIYALGEVYRYQGRVLTQNGEYAAAKEALDRALDIQTKNNAVPTQAFIHFDLVRWHLAQGQVDESRAIIQALEPELARLNMDWHLMQARILLRTVL